MNQAKILIGILQFCKQTESLRKITPSLSEEYIAKIEKKKCIEKFKRKTAIGSETSYRMLRKQNFIGKHAKRQHLCEIDRKSREIKYVKSNTFAYTKRIKELEEIQPVSIFETQKTKRKGNLNK